MASKDLNINPFIHTPLTDLTSVLELKKIPGRNEKLCAKLESKLLDCLEAYGCKRGLEKCKALHFDYKECLSGDIQYKRCQEIRKERWRLYREGKLEKPFDEYPPLDSFIL